MPRFYTAILSLLIVFVLGACTTDALPEPIVTSCDNAMPTYAVDVRLIIEESCAYSGCHLGGAPGLYDTYGGLLPDLESGLFRQRVLLRRNDPNVGMPPDYSPADRPQDLTEDELVVIECWLDAGFPEN